MANKRIQKFLKNFSIMNDISIDEGSSNAEIFNILPLMLKILQNNKFSLVEQNDNVYLTTQYSDGRNKASVLINGLRVAGNDKVSYMMEIDDTVYSNKSFVQCLISLVIKSTTLTLDSAQAYRDMAKSFYIEEPIKVYTKDVISSQLIEIFSKSVMLANYSNIRGKCLSWKSNRPTAFSLNSRISNLPLIPHSMYLDMESNEISYSSSLLDLNKHNKTNDNCKYVVTQKNNIFNKQLIVIK